MNAPKVRKTDALYMFSYKVAKRRSKFGVYTFPAQRVRREEHKLTLA